MDFDKSTDPQNLVDYEIAEGVRCQEHAKKGEMYGSACYTDFVCTCDGLLEYFEQGFTVENALSQCAIDGYDVDGSFDYNLSESELKAHHALCHKNGWNCQHDCEVCDKA